MRYGLPVIWPAVPLEYPKAGHSTGCLIPVAATPGLRRRTSPAKPSARLPVPTLGPGASSSPAAADATVNRYSLISDRQHLDGERAEHPVRHLWQPALPGAKGRSERRVSARLSGDFRVVGTPATLSIGPACGRPGRIFIHHSSGLKRSHLPLTD